MAFFIISRVNNSDKDTASTIGNDRLNNRNTFTEIARVGEGKKIYLLEYVTEEQLIVVLSGKQRHVRLVPVRALDGDEVEWIKVAETKGCITLTTGIVRRNPLTYCLCVAIKKQVRRLYGILSQCNDVALYRSQCV